MRLVYTVFCLVLAGLSLVEARMIKRNAWEDERMMPSGGMMIILGGRLQRDVYLGSSL